jgi:hypothetical protein
MKNARKWTTPLLTGTALLVAVTGVLMFFHAASGLARWTHEWLGLLMVVAAAVHVVVNARGLWVSLRPSLAKVAVAAFVAMTLVASVLPAQRKGQHGPPGATAGAEASAATAALADAPLERLAPLLEASPAELQQKAVERGLRVPGEQASVRQIALASDRQPSEVLDLLFR